MKKKLEGKTKRLMSSQDENLGNPRAPSMLLAGSSLVVMKRQPQVHKRLVSPFPSYRYRLVQLS
jgi:hypothetical protein